MAALWSIVVSPIVVVVVSVVAVVVTTEASSGCGDGGSAFLSVTFYLKVTTEVNGFRQTGREARPQHLAEIPAEVG